MTILRGLNGEEIAYVAEFKRKFSPKVSKKQLTSAVERLKIEYIVPTEQQATLLHSAGVMPSRGAPGRLMKMESMEKLLQGFGVSVLIGKQSNKVSGVYLCGEEIW